MYTHSPILQTVHCSNLHKKQRINLDNLMKIFLFGILFRKIGLFDYIYSQKCDIIDITILLLMIEWLFYTLIQI